MDEALIRSIVQEVLTKIGTTSTSSTAVPVVSTPKPTKKVVDDGVFATAAEAAVAAHEAYIKLQKIGVAGREKIVQVVKRMSAAKAEEWGRIEFEETRIGRLEHKIAKLQGIPKVPGTEWLSPYGMSGDHGISMEENCPFGVIGAITPVTHSIPTLACNAINMVAAGNTVVFNAHPKGARCAAMAVREFNRAIVREVGISNVLTIIETPTLESFDGICKHELIKLICVTGGPGIVKAAMKSGKRAICAGPGNPPVVVDETADWIWLPAQSFSVEHLTTISYVLVRKRFLLWMRCTARFLEAFERAGAKKLNDAQLARLTEQAFTFTADAGGCSHPAVNRDLVGADAYVLARHAGLHVPESTQMLYAETDADHLFVVEEQMMPMLPIIRVKDVWEGIEKARIAEHGYKHSSMIHTMNVRHMTAMARALESTVFVKNGACLAGLGSGGEGYASFSIATTTGEGITTPATFTRKRRCVLVDNLNMI
ncbi:MAG: aldehyde dehydrogenase [Verrucomicrobia bacterium]|nr:aldehyde dehydrogenase [Verrucomicrobiota bacterium]